jgi:hypothetical protein
MERRVHLAEVEACSEGCARYCLTPRIVAGDVDARFVGLCIQIGVFVTPNIKDGESSRVVFESREVSRKTQSQAVCPRAELSPLGGEPIVGDLAAAGSDRN